jgi:hypothetical protein
MTEHADHRFSATLSSPDLALIGCLRALAEFSEETGNDTGLCEDTMEKDWRAAGQKVTFRFSRALYRDLFKNEVRRLLPANLVRFDAESDNDRPRPHTERLNSPLRQSQDRVTEFGGPGER